MNKIEIKFNATLENEAVIRNTIGLFASTRNCTIEDIIDVKTIISEAISNAIIHGYGTGTIRNLVQDYLRKNKNVQSFRYGGAGEGGMGSTVVILK